MPIKVAENLPAKKIMEEENIFMMGKTRALSQEIRPLKIGILNLMPLKEDTEVQMLRSLSNTPLQLEITFITTATYIGKNTPQSHLDEFYKTYEDIQDLKLDGLIITGAPVEKIDFEEVIYWEELKHIMEWSKSNVTSTLHICWGAYAGLYYHYGIIKKPLKEKLFGVYKHQVYHRKTPLLRGFDDEFYIPHSRHTMVAKEDIYANKELIVLADSEEAGIFLMMNQNGSQIYMTGHPEYDRMTLDKEYKRDLEGGLAIEKPVNYYWKDRKDRPLLTWRAHSNALYTNWINYYVYQQTPYEW